MTKALIAIFIGGGIGSMLRYLVQVCLQSHFSIGAFQWATFSANLIGSFLIGLFYVAASRFNLSDEARLFLTTGLCGGFTTFSTFSYENLNLLREGNYTTFALYTVLSFTLGIAAAFAGGYAGSCLK